MSEPTLIPPWDRDERNYRIAALESQLAAAQKEREKSEREWQKSHSMPWVVLKNENAALRAELNKALESTHEPTCAIRTSRDGWEAGCNCLRAEVERLTKRCEEARPLVELVDGQNADKWLEVKP